MTVIHLDAVGGVAGDMFVAALLDALPDLRPRVLADAAAALPPGVGRPVLEEGSSSGIHALRFGLAAEHGAHPAEDSSFPALAARIGAARLAEGTAVQATAILTILAEAEAGIHGIPVERVHFHELADWDSLLDVVAAGSIAAALHSARWTVSPLPRGGGVVRTAHGMLPVPAPATAAILEGFEWRDDGVAGERVTPTGAAILRHLVRATLPGASGRLRCSGAGAGTRVLPAMPNILRALVFEPAQPPMGDRVTLIAFEIDDMTGEEIGIAAERLRALPGVLDLAIAQLWGKKGRPVQSFRLILRPDAADGVAARCFEETSTIGLRVDEQSRIVLRRDLVQADDIGVKTVYRPESGVTRKAESDAVGGATLAERRARKQKVEREAE
jgi:uncharacterized protein (TIGR00299 family) protein